MLGQAAGQRPRAAADPACVVLGAITPRSARIGHIQLVEMQQVDDAGHGASPTARATAAAIEREFAAPMIDSR